MARTLPLNLKRIFWDTDFSAISLKHHRSFIIERVLEHGDEPAVRWLYQTFPRRTIAAAAKKSRRLSPKSKNYWNLKLLPWRKQSPRSAKTPSEIWQY